MSDTYSNYEELAANEVYGVDYRIVSNDLKSKFICMTPHGGGIEVGTSELVFSTGDSLASTYAFEGLKSSGNGTLHITSTNFDEPIALQLVGSSEKGISFHGYADSEVKHTIVGGADETLKQAILEALTLYGFNASLAEDRFAGADPDNIINKTTSGAGVQLELSTAQRKAFFLNNDWSKSNRVNRTEEFYGYVKAIRDVIQSQ